MGALSTYLVNDFLVDFKHDFPSYANQIGIIYNINIYLVIIKNYKMEIGGVSLGNKMKELKV